MRKARTIAIVLVVVGVAAFALPTFATEGFNTDRPASFLVDSDNDALIGSETTQQSVTHPTGGSGTATVGRLTNNFDSEVTLDYRVRVSDSSVEASAQSVPVTLQPGESADITAQCRNSGNQGTATVTATVDSAHADGVGVEDISFDFDLQYDCVDRSESSRSGENEEINEYCANSAAGEDENENENENENEGDTYTYTYEYQYDYKNGNYRYEYQYDYEWSESATQEPDPDPDTTPDQSLECVNENDDVEIEIEPEPEPEPEPPDD